MKFKVFCQFILQHTSNSIVKIQTFSHFRLAVKLGSFTRVNYTIEVQVIKVISHKDFGLKHFMNDIGLLKLDSYGLKKKYINSRDGM